MTPNQLQRGLVKDKPLTLSDDADCLSEISMVLFTNNDKIIEGPHRKVAHIVGHAGEKTMRDVAPVWIWKDGKPVKVFADIVTGTLYRPNGDCMSSDVRKVVKWSKYVPVIKQPKPSGRVQAQVDWNEGL